MGGCIAQAATPAQTAVRFARCAGPRVTYWNVPHPHASILPGCLALSARYALWAAAARRRAARTYGSRPHAHRLDAPAPLPRRRHRLCRPRDALRCQRHHGVQLLRGVAVQQHQAAPRAAVPAHQRLHGGDNPGGWVGKGSLEGLAAGVCRKAEHRASASKVSGAARQSQLRRARLPGFAQHAHQARRLLGPPQRARGRQPRPARRGTPPQTATGRPRTARSRSLQARGEGSVQSSARHLRRGSATGRLYDAQLARLRGRKCNAALQGP